MCMNSVYVHQSSPMCTNVYVHQSSMCMNSYTLTIGESNLQTLIVDNAFKIHDILGLEEV